MKRMVFMVCMLALMLARPSLAADQLVYSEDFETMAEGDITPTDWAMGGIGATATAKALPTVMDGTVAGVKSLQLDDLDNTGNLKIGITSAALMNHNSGNGIAKGRVEFNFRSLLEPPAPDNTSTIFMRLYDDYTTLGTTPLAPDLLTDLILARTGPFIETHFEGTSEGTSSPLTWAKNTDYRAVITFDIATRDVTAVVTSGAPGFGATVFDATGKTMFLATDGFKGVRGLMIDTAANRKASLQFDNIKFFDTAGDPVVTGAKIWRQY